MGEINQRHLEFLDEAREVFGSNILRETHINIDGDLIALRYGADRNCIRIFELGEEVGFFSQMIGRTDCYEFLRAWQKAIGIDVEGVGPVENVRPELSWFAGLLESQLQECGYSDGWSHCTDHYLIQELERNLNKLKQTTPLQEEFRRHCANIAIFAMMIADNDRRRQE